MTIGARKYQNRRRLHEPRMNNELETWDGHSYDIWNPLHIFG
jgi:hypothetical protein